MLGQTWTDVKRKHKKRLQIEKINVVSSQQNCIIYPWVFLCFFHGDAFTLTETALYMIQRKV